jgi:cytochrome P450
LQRHAPRSLAQVDLFAPGAQEHRYDAYAILHAECPVRRRQGEGLTPDSDAFVLTKHEDVAGVVKDRECFPLDIPAWWSARA